MTQPSVYHRICFAFFLSTLAMSIPEVVTMNDPIAAPGHSILGRIAPLPAARRPPLTSYSIRA